LNLGYPILDIALTLTLPDFQRLTGYWLIREHTNPDLSASLDVPRHCPASRFYLTGRQTTATYGLQSVFSEAHLATTLCQATVAALHHLAKFCTLWLKHLRNP
jgi:hypothetical protein